jgi:hypothetical protein
VAFAVLLAGCSRDEIETSVGTVILFRSPQAKKSAVYHIGSRCWVAWYSGIEKLVLNRDGTIDDGLFHYRWMLDRRGPDDQADDQKWFDANCVDAPGREK